jgi:hypothetical protein
MILVQSRLTGKPDTIVGCAFDATGDGHHSGGFEPSFSDAILALPASQKNKPSKMSESISNVNDLRITAEAGHHSGRSGTAVVAGNRLRHKARRSCRFRSRPEILQPVCTIMSDTVLHVDERFFRKVVEEYRPVGLGRAADPFER